MNNLLKYFDEKELEFIKNDDIYTKADKIVKRLFKDILDKGGNSYLNHLYHVSNYFEDINMKIIGLLHDVIEDTIITANDLIQIGFDNEIVDVVSIVSRNDNESYNDYIDRILRSNNDKAINIKIVDIKHNMDLSRIENPTEKDIERIERKYKPQYKKIINYLKKENEI